MPGWRMTSGRQGIYTCDTPDPCFDPTFPFQFFITTKDSFARITRSLR
jgi:hypothetical protein